MFVIGAIAMKRFTPYFSALICLAFLITSSHGEAQTATSTPVQPNASSSIPVNAAAICLEDGYRIEPAVLGLSVPTTAIFDGNDLLVAESGFLKTAAPRVVRIHLRSGTTTPVVSTGLEEPVTGLLKHQGKLYVSHRGKVSIIEPEGTLRDIITDLPSYGDHHNNKLVAGPDGKIYIGQGTATNSGVVGEDNELMSGWLSKYVSFHDKPCKDVTLRGINFSSKHVVDPEGGTVSTGAFMSYGASSSENQIVKGTTPCNGAILRFDPDGKNLEVYAWGMRNPFGLAFDTTGTLWTTYHGADVRGDRPIYNDPDYLIKVEKDAWYGWPDYFDGEPVSASRFQITGKPKLEFLLKKHPPLTKPYLTFDPHTGTNGIAFAPKAFGNEGDMFIAAYGTYAPATTGTNLKPVGFRVLRLDMKTKKISDFAANILPGPSYINRGGGFSRPSDVLFGPDNALYVVDWGGATISSKGLELTPGTGSIWRIYTDTDAALRPQGPVIVRAAAFDQTEREPLLKNQPRTYAMLASYFQSILLLIAIAVGVYLLAKQREK